MILADHSVTEAIALFVPAVAIVTVIAGAVVIDRRRAAQEDAENPDSPAPADTAPAAGEPTS
ncbi:hypothetical protein LO762_12695 [Actinocorallia sp. API 0066]|uniref:hypothetical protein n=1 Tax=Actinocorallia sp. API 0066 TaxID=2896846 RepID=UPI001E54212D|nr:hypothetical protein [Actinocorallia sp. API 0066]MCD0450044.1 hypothetical protein [Actinocorallia sp. API 0066]